MKKQGLNISEIKNRFPDELSALRYLAELRWGKWASCPYCDNKKAYIIEKGLRYKCANQKCYKKFSVKTNTLLHGSNVTTINWIIAVKIYSNLRENTTLPDIQRAIQSVKLTAGYIKDKLDFCWKYVVSEIKSDEEIESQLWEAVFNLFEKHESFTRKNIYNFQCTDISNITHYNAALKYAKYWLRRATWIFINQFEAEDVIAEAFIYMQEQGIKDYDGNFVAFMIRKHTQRLWMKWVYSHPNTHEYYRNYSRNWQRKSRQMLMPTYIHAQIKKKNPHLVSSEIQADRELIAEQKRKIIDFRKRYNLMDGFHSHFE